MLFTSLEYALFLPLVFALYWTLPIPARKPLLLAASFVFYAAWDWRFLGLILFSTAVDWLCGRTMPKVSRPKARLLLWLSLTCNLGVLGFFKFFNFFADSLRELLGWGAPSTLNIILPVGISFFTFQSMSYTLDIYRGKQKPAPVLDVFLFVAFFPQLVAGPIVRAVEFLPQLAPLPRFSMTNLYLGSSLFVRGLCKKLLFADSLARFSDPVFAAPAAYSPVENLLALYAFAFQIYFDFSAYTDMARGSAKTLGFDFPENFRLPYLAHSIRDFWRRWHITLSTWLRDYLYVSLGGNRGNILRICRNLLITMVLGGLWHGAAWTFLVWGLLHGAALAAERLWSARKALGADVPVRPLGAPGQAFPIVKRTVSILAVFHFVCLGWAIFRAQTLGEAASMLTRIGEGFLLAGQGNFSAAGLPFHKPETALVFTALLVFAVWHALSGFFVPNPCEPGLSLNAPLQALRIRLAPHWDTVRVTLSAAGVGPAFIYSTQHAPFLYFQF